VCVHLVFYTSFGLKHPTLGILKKEPPLAIEKFRLRELYLSRFTFPVSKVALGVLTFLSARPVTVPSPYKN
jgi:hypothetical protein